MFYHEVFVLYFIYEVPARCPHLTGLLTKKWKIEKKETEKKLDTDKARRTKMQEMEKREREREREVERERNSERERDKGGNYIVNLKDEKV